MTEPETVPAFELDPPAGTVLPEPSDDAPGEAIDPEDQNDPEDTTPSFQDAMPGEDPPTDEPTEG